MRKLKDIVLYGSFIFMVFAIGSIFEGVELPRWAYVVTIVGLLIYIVFKDEINKISKG